jgi:hypothetical protein
LLDFYHAIDRYNGFREAVYEVALENVWATSATHPAYANVQDVAIQFGPIDGQALQSWHKNQGTPIFPWDRLRHGFKNYLDRFDLAVWGNGRVCALAIGRPSQGNQNVTIHFVERWMDDKNPLAGLIIPIVTDVADAYALALGKDWVKAKDPVLGAIAAYERVGFAKGANLGQTQYWERRVER